MNDLLTKRNIRIGVAVLAVLLLFVGFLSLNGKQKDMVKKETDLSQAYLDAQNVLSSYISEVRESLGVADRSTDALDKVLSDAVRGRYTEGSTAQPGGGELFSAIVEAYPDLSQVGINYQEVQRIVSAGRTRFSNEQSHLLSMVGEYNTWRNSGFIHSMLVGMIGAPSDNLRADNGTDVVYGEDALDRINDIVRTPEGNDAYRTGQMAPLDLNPTETPAP